MLLLGLEIALPTLFAVGYKCYKEWEKKQVLKRIHLDLTNVINRVDDVDDPLEMVHVKQETKQLKKRLRYHGISAVVKAAQFAEMKVGLLKDTPANRLVIDKIIRDYMMAPKGVGLGMRVSHAVRDYRVAVSMYFKPRAQSVVLDKVDQMYFNSNHYALKELGLDGSS